ncbi:PPC domain-containing DNA-binding protein [Devosia sp. ZW T5_3]|uniref:PPC domain-containing DNA-binding protein n=1 Tax=Devosia sp. ZW T5_3 TaxID=3378085 RepID=UPI0038554C13
MKSRLMADASGTNIFVLVLEPGEEALAAITTFAAENHIGGASVTAIGAFERAVLGWFDFKTKDYRPIAVDTQCEVLSVLGDIAEDDSGKPSVHLHAVVGLSDGSTRGGHLLAGIVKPTLEITLVETPRNLRRRKRPELGIALVDLDLMSPGSVSR